MADARNELEGQSGRFVDTRKLDSSFNETALLRIAPRYELGVNSTISQEEQTNAGGLEEYGKAHTL